MSLTIPNYENWVVGEARTNAQGMQLEIEIENLPDSAADQVESATIKKNAPGSEPGDPIMPGGIVSVIIFPLENRDG